MTICAYCRAQAVRTPDTAIGESNLEAIDASGIDNVDITNGNLYLKIPLISFPQVGSSLRLNFNIFYNDKSWAISWLPPNPQFPSSQQSGNWQPLNNGGVRVSRDQALSIGIDNTRQVSYEEAAWGSISASTYYYSGYVVTPDGTAHYVWDQVWQNCSQQGAALGAGCPQSYGTYTTSYPATDSSGYQAQPWSSSLGSAWSATGPDGITYTATSVSDPNGNTINVTNAGWTDSIKRLIPGSNTGPGSYLPSSGYTGNFGNVNVLPVFSDLTPGIPTQDLSHCPGSPSGARIWSLPSTTSEPAVYYLCYSQFTYQTDFNINNTTGHANVSEVSGSVQLLSAIVLPNDTSYTFNYDSYLSLSHLGLPSGGSIDYTWQTIPALAQWSSYSNPVNRALRTRTINPGGASPSQIWTYTWTHTQPNQNPVWSIVTDPYGNDVAHELAGQDLAGNYIRLGTEIRTEYYQGCSPVNTAANRVCNTQAPLLLRTQDYVLAPIMSYGASVGTAAYSAETLGSYERTKTLTTTPTATGAIYQTVSKEKTPGYGTCQEMNLQIMQWNSSTAPTYTPRNPCSFTNEDQAEHTYSFATKPDGGSLLRSRTTTFLWQIDPAYLNANLLEAVQKIVTSDGTGGWGAETDYAYDENNGSPIGARGNLTSTTQINDSGPNSTTHGVYNPNGTLSQISDANGNLTNVSYQCSGSLIRDISNPLQQKSTYGYDCGTGLLVGYQTANDIAASRPGTSYTYDNMRNLTAVVRPDGGSTAIDYHGYGTPLNVTKTTTADPDPSIATTTSYDGFLQATQVVNLDGSTIDTVHDLLNRPWKVTNPHLSTPSATDGTTTTTYDALGRIAQIQQPDLNTKTYKYDGNVLTLTDESGHSWVQTLDALGHTTGVAEPNGAQTTYSYNVRGDLLAVVQSGIPSESPRTRSFSYDSLSRLITSRNPETGLICYGQLINGLCAEKYDGNGNLITKTDQRGLVTSYVYDALNRPTQIASPLVGGTAPTSMLKCYTYDGSTDVAITANLVGHATAEWTELGSVCSPAYDPSLAYTATLFLSYDPMGRLLQSQQCLRGSCQSVPFTQTYGYNLAGNMNAWTNGIGGQFQLTHDNVGRPVVLSSGRFGPSIPPVLWSVQHYLPAGLLQTWSDGSEINFVRTYDDRLRVQGETVTH